MSEYPEEYFEEAELVPPTPPVIALSVPQSSPLWTYVLIAVNGLVFLGSLLVGQELVLLLGAKINEAIVLGQWWRLITPLFLHVDILHIGFNSYALFSFGQEVERYFGRSRFLLAYLLAGVGGTTVSFLLSENPAVGASGAIFGLVGIMVTYYYRYRRQMRAGSSALSNIIVIVVINLIYGFINPGVDNWGHVGGLLTGIILGWFFAPEYQVVQPDPQQMPQVVDSSSPARWAVGVMLAGLGILMALIGGIIRWSG